MHGRLVERDRFYRKRWIDRDGSGDGERSAAGGLTRQQEMRVALAQRGRELRREAAAYRQIFTWIGKQAGTHIEQERERIDQGSAKQQAIFVARPLRSTHQARKNAARDQVALCWVEKAKQHQMREQQLEMISEQPFQTRPIDGVTLKQEQMSNVRAVKSLARHHVRLRPDQLF